MESKPCKTCTKTDLRVEEVRFQTLYVSFYPSLKAHFNGATDGSCIHSVTDPSARCAQALLALTQSGSTKHREAINTSLRQEGNVEAVDAE